eukprot:7736929-Pyramimonas_sp.AAC.1
MKEGVARMAVIVVVVDVVAAAVIIFPLLLGGLGTICVFLFAWDNPVWMGDPTRERMWDHLLVRMAVRIC